jgi:hypothetical protein
VLELHKIKRPGGVYAFGVHHVDDDAFREWRSAAVD